MREKKHIDRLYQEKFREFEATPNEAVWRSISARLQEKQQKKPVFSPLWSRVAGIAAILSIIFLIGDWIFPGPVPTRVASEDLEENFTDENTSIAEHELPEKSVVLSSGNSKIGRNVSELSMGTVSTISSVKGSETPRNAHGIHSELSVAALEIPKETPITKKFNKRSLFDDIRVQEEPVVENTSGGKFEISTHAAPIYYGNFGDGNFLDPRFNNNNSEGEITYSYGINIAYNISEKIKIRSGVSKVNMSYNTTGIAYHAVAGPVDIHSVSYKSTEVQMVDRSGRSSINKQPLQNNTRSGIGSLNSGVLNQQMGFIEVPVELEYNLIDSKFGLHIIGGASTLFLEKNRVSLNSGKVSAVGEAKNLNEVSFTTNIGLGLDYKLSNKFKLNLEPMLKYQFKTFNAPTGGTQPYYLGVYSGFSFKF